MSVPWQDFKSVIECNKYMLENQIDTDVTFLVSNKNKICITLFAGDFENDDGETLPITETEFGDANVKEFRAHSYMLKSRSSFFSIDMIKSNPQMKFNNEGALELDDIEPMAFNQVLRYLYLDEFIPNPSLVMFTLHAAKKFKIPLLQKKCIDYLKSFLKEDISPEKLLMILDYSIFFKEKKLAERCRRWVVRHTQEVLQARNFSKISQETLLFMVQAAQLKCSELEIFLACLEWAKTQASLNLGLNTDGIRDYLGEDILKEIHFGAIPLNDFVENVSTSGILHEVDEELKVLRYLGARNKENFEIPFSHEDRSYEKIPQKEISINFDQNDHIQHVFEEDKPERKTIVFNLKLSSELPTMVKKLVVKNQIEETDHHSSIKVQIENLYDGTPSKSAEGEEASLDLGSNVRLAPWEVYNMTITYVMNPVETQKSINFLCENKLEFADEFNYISFKNTEGKNMPILKVEYQVY